MEENLHNDKLEQFFQKTLDEYGSDPSDDLWDRIAADIPPVPPAPPSGFGINPQWLIGFGGMILVAAIAFLVYKTNSKINHLENTLTHKEVEIKDLNDQLNTVKNKQRQSNTTLNNTVSEKSTSEKIVEGNLTETSDLKSAKGIVASELTKNGLTNAQKKNDKIYSDANKTIASANTSKDTPSLNNNGKELSTNNQQAATTNVQTTNKTVDNSNYNNMDNELGQNVEVNDPKNISEYNVSVGEALTTKENKDAAIIETSVTPLVTKLNLITALPRRPISFPSNRGKSLETIVKLSKQRLKRNLSIGLYSGYDGYISESNSLVAADISYNSIVNYDLSLLATVKLNHNLSLVFGFGGRSMDASFGLSFINIYTEENANIEDGFTTRIYPQSFETDFGNMTIAPSIENTLIMDGMDVVEGTPFYNSIGINQSFKYLRIPMQLKYEIGNGRLRGITQGGITFNSLISISHTLIDYSIVNARMRYLGGGVSSVNNVKSFFFETNLEAGAEYKLSRRFYLSLTGKYTKAITSIASSSKPQSIGLRLGLRYNL